MLAPKPHLLTFPSPLATAAATPPYTADVMEPALRAWLAGIAVVVLVGALLIFLRYWRQAYKTRVIWTMSIAVTTLLAVGIVAMWIVVAAMPVALNVGHPLLSQDDVGAALRAAPSDKMGSVDQPAPILVPTGVYIRTIQFTGPHNLTLSGVLWQKYPLETPDDVDRGVSLPDATSTTFTEISRTPQSTGTLIRWDFTADLRQIFVYDRYPLDRQDIWLRMRPAETETPVVLTPDLTAYPSIAPTTKPGLTQLAVLEGWYPVQTYFSYATTAANTTFGDERGAREAQFPELYYTVTVKRDLIVPFLTYLFPVLIAAIMLFFGLMISTKELERRSQIGWNVASILSYCAALLFVVLLAHINMRSVVGAEGLLYIGYFYFALYALIMLTLLNAVLLVSRTEWKWITHADNLIPKAIYWPLYLGAIFLLTLLAFAT
jgi:hypothetical protein